MIRTLQDGRGAAPTQPRRERVGVDDDPAGQSSFSAAWNASHFLIGELRDVEVVTDVIMGTPAAIRSRGAPARSPPPSSSSSAMNAPSGSGVSGQAFAPLAARGLLG